MAPESLHTWLSRIVVSAATRIYFPSDVTYLQWSIEICFARGAWRLPVPDALLLISRLCSGNFSGFAVFVVSSSKSWMSDPLYVPAQWQNTYIEKLHHSFWEQRHQSCNTWYAWEYSHASVNTITTTEVSAALLFHFTSTEVSAALLCHFEQHSLIAWSTIFSSWFKQHCDVHLASVSMVSTVLLQTIVMIRPSFKPALFSNQQSQHNFVLQYNLLMGRYLLMHSDTIPLSPVLVINIV